MKYKPHQAPNIYGYIFFPTGTMEIPYLIPPSHRLLLSLFDQGFPIFFVHEINFNDFDLENIHPADVANQLVNAGLLIDTHISYN